MMSLLSSDPMTVTFFLANVLLGITSLLDLGALLCFTTPSGLLLRLCYTMVPIGSLTTAFAILQDNFQYEAPPGQLFVVLGMIFFTVRLYRYLMRRSLPCPHRREKDAAPIKM